MSGRISYYGNIVKDGLVLCLDAAKKDSYPRSGDVWNDISGGQRNGTLINGPTFNPNNDGSIVFDGINDYVINNTPFNTGQNITVSAWIYRNTTGRLGIFTNSYPFSFLRGWYFLAYTNSSLALSVGSDQSYIISQNNTVPINSWNYVTGTITNGKTSKLYNNGVELSLVANVGSSVNIIYDQSWKVGALVSPLFDAFNGNISLIHIYNKVLTQDEILQNYNATKNRYL